MAPDRRPCIVDYRAFQEPNMPDDNSLLARDCDGPGAAIPDTCIMPFLSFEDYLASGRVSKSGLWTLYNRSPAHARWDMEPSPAMKLGSAIHCAILEPHAFAERYARGPEDRRGKRWTEQEALAWEEGQELLTSGDFDRAQMIRNVVRQNPIIQRITGAQVEREVSCFWVDQLTGLKCRARPDAYARAGRLMVDIKTTADARLFDRRVGEFGYHVQEAFYTDGWRAVGQDIDAFLFLVIEPEPPFAHRLVELVPEAVEEGRAIARKALDRWAECEAAGKWPAYSPDVAEVDLRKWDYRETKPYEEEEA
jgi:exodeoxyribonuclease VIII